MDHADIEKILYEKFPQARITLTGDNYHVQLLIVDDFFINLSRLQRHRAVHELLGPFIQSGLLHAVTLKLFTPKEALSE